MPIATFPRRGRNIVSSYYQIAWQGQTVTVYCSGSWQSDILICFIGDWNAISMPLREAESLLLTKVISDPERPSRLAARKIEPARLTALFGMSDDGEVYAWDSRPVIGISQFPRYGRYIEGSIYVLDWHGRALVAECRGLAHLPIRVQFLYSTKCLHLPRQDVEAMLLGQVVSDKKSDTKMAELLDLLGEAILQAQQTPKRLQACGGN